MEFENTIIYIALLITIIFLFLQFFISNNNTKERIKVLLEQQLVLEKSISELIVRHFDKMDSKFDRENVSHRQGAAKHYKFDRECC